MVICAAAYVVSLDRIEADMASFFPPAATAMPAAPLAGWVAGAPSSRMILAALEGGNAQQRAHTSRTLATRWRQNSALSSVINGDGTDRPVIAPELLPYRYLLSPEVSSRRFTAESLESAFADIMRQLSGPLGPMDRNLMFSDPTGELQALMEYWSSDRQPSREHGVWASSDGERALLLLEPVASALDLDIQEDLLDDLDASFQALPEAAGLKLLLSGQPVFGVYSRDLIRSEIMRLSIAASLLVLFILALAYRSISMILLVGLPLICAILVASAAVMLMFGSLHGITLAFGITLLGIAVDYPVHLFGHRRSGEPPGTTIHRIWPTLRLSALTTVLGFSAMILSSLTGLAQLGVFAVVGLLTAAAATRYLLPWLIPVRMGATATTSGPGWLTWSPPAWGVWIVLAAGVAAALILTLHRDAIWEDDLAAMNPLPVELRTLDARLRADLGVADLRYLALIHATDAQDILEASEALAAGLTHLGARGVFTDFDHPARFLASARTQDERRAFLPEPDILVQRIETAAQSAGIRAHAFEPFLRDMEIARSLEPLSPEDVIDALPDIGLGRLLFPVDNGWIGIVAFRGVKDGARLEDWFRDRGDGWLMLDTKAQVERVLSDFRNEALQWFIFGALVIVVVLALGLRSLRQALRVATPALLAAVVAAAILVLTGGTLSLFHLVSLLLAVGLGLDYALFFNRFRGDSEESRRARRALLVCGLSTLAVFGILAGSPLPVLKAIGETVALGALLAWLFAVMASAPRTRGD